jgi:hypothetical protein
MMQVVEAVRKADLIDFSLGLVTYGMPAAARTDVNQLPNAGFHACLMGFIPRVRGWNVFLGAWELFHIFAW